MIGITLPWSHMPSWCEQGQLSWHTHPDTHTHTYYKYTSRYVHMHTFKYTKYR